MQAIRGIPNPHRSGFARSAASPTRRRQTTPSRSNRARWWRSDRSRRSSSAAPLDPTRWRAFWRTSSRCESGPRRRAAAGVRHPPRRVMPIWPGRPGRHGRPSCCGCRPESSGPGRRERLSKRGLETMGPAMSPLAQLLCVFCLSTPAVPYPQVSREAADIRYTHEVLGQGKHLLRLSTNSWFLFANHDRIDHLYAFADALARQVCPGDYRFIERPGLMPPADRY
jgi:hypothetical protein